MLRVHLTPDDLGKITIAGPDVMGELVTSAWSLAKRQPSTARTQILRHVTPAARALLRLTADPDWCPDFLTPGAGVDFATSLDMILATPEHQVRAELAPLADGHPWARDSKGVLAALGPALAAYRREVFARYQDIAMACVVADRAVRARMVLGGGVDQLLRTLHPGIRWAPPVLTVDCMYDADVFLGGRGLRLEPMYFVRRPGITDRDGEPLRLVYPADARDQLAAHVGDRLGPLVGHTRADVLRAVTGAGLTTSQLARYLAISAASASEHATVLRGAGLVTSKRAGNAVVHALTPLGATLLRVASGADADGQVTPAAGRHSKVAAV